MKATAPSLSGELKLALCLLEGKHTRVIGMHYMKNVFESVHLHDERGGEEKNAVD